MTTDTNHLALRNLCHEVATRGPKNWRVGLLSDLAALLAADAAAEGGEAHSSTCASHLMYAPSSRLDCDCPNSGSLVAEHHTKRCTLNATPRPALVADALADAVDGYLNANYSRGRRELGEALDAYRAALAQQAGAKS